MPGKYSMLNTKSDSIIIVTGATGWVGRSLLHELQKAIPCSSFNSSVLAFGSKATVIASTAYREGCQISIPIIPLQDIVQMARGRNILLVHTAFLTKDRLANYGYSKFVEINRRITDMAYQAAQEASSSRIVAISSGAAALAEQRNEESLDNALDPYGFLKLQEEKLLHAVTATQVLRIYALTGQFIRDPLSFAIGDFLVSALERRPIHIYSKGPVIRGYVSASDVAQCALHWLASEEKPLPPVPAVSHVASLTTLAAKITSIYQLDPVVIESMSEPANSYSHSPLRFLEMLSRFSIKPNPFNEQILDTARGIEAWNQQLKSGDRA
jgi:nucleoside-diphosphate-sugar epimerase